MIKKEGKRKIEGKKEIRVERKREINSESSTIANSSLF